jgi:hypothetical protein
LTVDKYSEWQGMDGLYCSIVVPGMWIKGENSRVYFLRLANFVCQWIHHPPHHAIVHVPEFGQRSCVDSQAWAWEAPKPFSMTLTVFQAALPSHPNS